MSTRPPSQPANDPDSGLHQLSSPPPALRAPPMDARLEGDGTFPNSIHYHQSPLQIDHSPATDPGTLVDLAGRLRSFLPPGYRWLEQDDLKVVGTLPVDAGGFADVWVGGVGDQRVAVKSYRCFTSADYIPTYNRFCHEALTCIRLTGQHVVPFVGVYSTQEHPFALVFEFMKHLNLGEYLRNNCEVGRRELLLGTARAIKDMHNVNAVHGNLKITNILIDGGGHVRIAGLGTVSTPSTGTIVDVDRSFHGAAPELIDPRRFGFVGTEGTKASDVYAFGIIAWEVFAGRAPFSDKSVFAGVCSMLEGHRPGRPDHPELSDRLWKLIKGCWESVAARRKTIAEVVCVLEAELGKAK